VERNQRRDEHISTRGDGVLLEDRAVTVAVGEAQNLWPFLIYSVTVVGLIVVILTLAWFVGSRTKHSAATDMPFESGIVPVGSAEETRLSIEFYLIALFFVIFDLETIFIFGWAVAFFELGWRGYFGASVFIGVLLVALVYELRSGALDWGVKHRHSVRDRYSVLPGSRA
jgi:NADH-quinone oxidoreductase subunit A